MDREFQIATFKLSKLEGFLQNKLAREAVSVGLLDDTGQERSIKQDVVRDLLQDAFQVGFDFGQNAGNQWPDEIKPDWFSDPEKLLDLVEGMLSRIGKIRYPEEGEPTPEQRAEYELDDKRHRVNNLALRLMDIPGLYGEYLQRDQVFDMAIRDALLWDTKVKEAVTIK